jgi:hypothetical protein
MASGVSQSYVLPLPGFSKPKPPVDADVEIGLAPDFVTGGNCEVGELVMIMWGLILLAHTISRIVFPLVFGLCRYEPYTAVSDPPLNEMLNSPALEEILALLHDRDALFVKWPDGKEVKAKIIRGKKSIPTSPNPPECRRCPVTSASDR